MNKKNIIENNNVDIKKTNEPQSEIEITFVEDPLFRFFKKWQNVIFWALVVIIACYFGYNKYSDIRINEQKSDADLFEEFRPIYANIITLSKDIKQKELEIQKDINKKKDTKGKEKDLNELKERLTKSLSEAQSRIKPLATSKYYSTISKLYSALLKKNAGDQKGFEEDINKIDFNNYKNESNEQSRFYKELASIIIAKAYLDDEMKISNAKELLTNLIKDGKYFNVVAFNTLSIIAKGEEEEELKKLKEELLSKAPEQSELLKN